MHLKMWNGRVRSKFWLASVISRVFLDSVRAKSILRVEPIIPLLKASDVDFNLGSSHTSVNVFPPYSFFQCTFSSCSSCNSSTNSNHEFAIASSKESIQHDASETDVTNDREYLDEDECDDDIGVHTDDKLLGIDNEVVEQDLKIILDILHGLRGMNQVEMKNKLESCEVQVSQALVGVVLSRIRNDWEKAFTFFLWAGTQPDYTHSLREYHSMISILGKFRKFDTAWTVINEMKMAKAGSSLVTPHTLLIMIRRYCAVHDVGRAINTFYAYKRFSFDIGLHEFQNLLSALCRYKNVKEAENLLFCNRNVFPFDIKSFNIILNGWCNVIGSVSEAERIWKEMTKRGVSHDVVSYASIISCYSKASLLYKVLRYFDMMKKVDIEQDIKVYNSVIYALAKGKLVKEAIKLIKTMDEKGIAPNVITYNSLIRPLCKARNIKEARQVFDQMVQRRVYPTMQTYHAFLRVLTTGEEVFLLLDEMKRMRCNPNSDTYIMLIRKFCRWRQIDDVLKLWNEMNEDGVGPDRSSYTVLIHGLFLNGRLEDAYKYYLEMKGKDLVPEPNIEERLQAWLAAKAVVESDRTVLETNTGIKTKKVDRKVVFHRLPERRRVVREKGFSFWDET